MDAVEYVKTQYRLCRSKDNCSECKNFYTPETDGLTASWNIGGGQRVLQPAVWPVTGRVGAQSL